MLRVLLPFPGEVAKQRDIVHAATRCAPGTVDRHAVSASIGALAAYSHETGRESVHDSD